MYARSSLSSEFLFFSTHFLLQFSIVKTWLSWVSLSRINMIIVLEAWDHSYWWQWQRVPDTYQMITTDHHQSMLGKTEKVHSLVCEVETMEKKKNMNLSDQLVGTLKNVSKVQFIINPYQIQQRIVFSAGVILLIYSKFCKYNGTMPSKYRSSS